VKSNMIVSVRGRYVITHEGEVLRDKAVVFEENRILAVTDVGRDVEYKPEEIVERKHHIVMPGFIDCHTHTQQILLRTSISDRELPLPPIWTRYLIPFERMLDDDLAHLSSLLSIAGKISSGVVYFVEAGAPRPYALIKALKETKMQGAVTMSTFDVLDGETPNTHEVLEEVERLLAHRSEGNDVWISIRQVMMATRELIEKLRDLALKHNVGLTLHLSEYQGEVDYTLASYGMRPLEFIDHIGLTRVKPLVIAHGVYLSEAEINIVKNKNLGICWCPTVDSLVMGEHWIPLSYDGLLFGVGSDGGAFTNLDILYELKVARALGKAINASLKYDKASLDSKTLFKAATGWGGSIVGRKMGLKPGDEASFIVINYKNIKTIPLYDPIEAVVSFIEGESVTDVVVRGNFLKKNGALTTIDKEKLENLIIELTPKLEEKIYELKMKLPIQNIYSRRALYS